MIFDPKEGRLRTLPIDFKKQVSQFSHIYDLYDKESNDTDDHYMFKKKKPPHTPPATVYDSKVCLHMAHELTAFCASATSGRDRSHGVEHMTDVCRGALSIFDALIRSGSIVCDSDHHHTHMRCMVIAAAQLHDVEDHKYTTDANSNTTTLHPTLCTAFLSNSISEAEAEAVAQSIIDVMAAVSFSKEHQQRHDPTVGLVFGLPVF